MTLVQTDFRKRLLRFPRGRFAIFVLEHWKQRFRCYRGVLQKEAPLALAPRFASWLRRIRRRARMAVRSQCHNAAGTFRSPCRRHTIYPVARPAARRGMLGIVARGG